MSGEPATKKRKLDAVYEGKELSDATELAVQSIKGILMKTVEAMQRPGVPTDVTIGNLDSFRNTLDLLIHSVEAHCYAQPPTL